MIAPSTALSLVLARCRLLPVERVALKTALGRVLARPVRADGDLPPADRSIMDGYAVWAGDLRSVPRELRLIGEAAAGSRPRVRVRPGTCVRILTGANIPPGADAVAVVESTSEASPTVIEFRASVEKGENVLRRGAHARKGQSLLDKGTRLGPQQISICAAAGADPVRVSVRARAVILCTGHELVAASGRATSRAQRDSNGPALYAALHATQLAQCATCEIVDDIPALLQRKARAALKRCHILILVGGVSVGKYDYVPQALSDLGCREVFHGVAMKPGKPTLFALGPDGQMVFGLPGNPLSALTAFHEFVAPALRKMSGLAAPPVTKLRVRLPSALVVPTTGRVRFLPARLRLDSDDGVPVATPIETEYSADVVAGGQCDGMLVLPEAREYQRGELVEFHSWSAAA